MGFSRRFSTTARIAGHTMAIWLGGAVLACADNSDYQFSLGYQGITPDQRHHHFIQGRQVELLDYYMCRGKLPARWGGGKLPPRKKVCRPGQEVQDCKKLVNALEVLRRFSVMVDPTYTQPKSVKPME